MSLITWVLIMNHEARLIVFDWDGTLMDSERHIVSCLRAASKDMGFELHNDDKLKSIIGLGLRESLQALFPNESDEAYVEYTNRYREHFYAETVNPATLFDGAEQLVKDLHQQGYLLGVATGKGRNGLDHILMETGLVDYFHLTRCADETQSKPHPQMLYEIMQRLDIEPIDTLMIGDTEYDMNMAVNAGVHPVAVTYGVHERHKLLQYDPLACFDSINDLRKWLLNERFNVA